MLEREYRVITTEIPEDAIAVCSIELSPEPFNAEPFKVTGDDQQIGRGAPTRTERPARRPRLPLQPFIG